MKSLIALSTGLLLCGCAKQTPDPHIVEIEQRYTALEARIAAHEERLAKFLKESRDEMDTAKVVLDTLQQNIDQNSFRITNLVFAVNRVDDRVDGLVRSNMTRIIYAGTLPAKTNTSNSSGIPESVMKVIRDEAAREYPRDFSMQEYTVRRQVESWLKLNR